MKIVINKCFGGFGLSPDAMMEYGRIKGFNLIQKQNKSMGYSLFYKEGIRDNEHLFSEIDIERTDPVLVLIVENMGGKANGKYSDLRVISIPDNIDWEIENYDGRESVHEKHESWY